MFVHAVTRRGAPLRVLLLVALLVTAGISAAGEAAAQTPAFTSHDFNTCSLPDGGWTFIDPRGDSAADVSGAGSGDAQLRLSVPAGAVHDPWNASNTTARVMQPAADTDFTVEVKFDSAVVSRYQEQGVLVEQDAGHWVRFDFYHDGSTVRSFAATTTGGVSVMRANVAVAGGTPSYLRVTRSGDSWASQYSFDRLSWTPAAAFTHPLAVARIGLFAGNFATGGSAPSHTAIVDYFYGIPGPVDTEDQGTPTGTATLALLAEGEGTVNADPAGPAYACGETVELSATAAVGWTFGSWAGALTGNETPRQLTLFADAAVTATFVDLTTSPPQLSDIAATATHDTATINWTTDEAATSTVSHGPTEAYELGEVHDATPVTAHAITLTGLTPDSVYHYRVSSAGAEGAAAQSGDLTFRTASAPGDSPAAISDDFNAPNLDTGHWRLVDPVGGATVAIDGAGTADAVLRLSVPAGASHDAWGVNATARVMQTVGDTDFAIEVKIDSPADARYQIQGLLVEEDELNWARFDFYSDGTAVHAFTATTVGGSSSARANSIIPAAGPLWMRVERLGDSWVQSYSADGDLWQQNAAFTHAMSVAAVGPFAGNFAASGPAPAHTAVFDYFFDLAAPITPEDANPAADTLPPLIHAISSTAAGDAASIEWATDEAATSVLRYGLTTAYELGTTSGAAWVFNHGATLSGLAEDTIYHFQIEARDAAGRSSLSADRTFVTGAVPGDLAIDVWYGDVQAFGAIGVPQQFVNVLGNVSNSATLQSLSYTLNGGPEQPLTVGPDPRRLDEPGDFNIEIDVDALLPGANAVAITAIDTLGQPVTRTVTVQWTAGTSWPLPSVTRWATAATIGGTGQVVDGRWTLTAEGVRVANPGYDRLIAIGDRTWTDYEVTVPVTVHSVDHERGDPSPSNGPGVGLGLRWQGHTAVSGEQPARGFWPAGAFLQYRWTPWGAERYEAYLEGLPVGTAPGSLQLGEPYLFKMRVETQPSGRGLYSFKAWPMAATEPAEWTLTREGVSDLAAGSVLLLAHHADVTFGDVVVTTLSGLSMSDPQVAATGYAATVEWTTSQPASSSVSYGPTAAYELGTVEDGSLVTQHAIRLTGLTPGTTYHIRALSADGAGAVVQSTDATFATGTDQCAGDQRIAQLTLRYTGDGPDATTHSQESRRVTVFGDPAEATPVRILVTNKSDPNDSKARIFFDDLVVLGESFTPRASAAGSTRLSRDTRFFVYAMDGELLQFVKFRTECTQPLFIGDQFGSLQLLEVQRVP